MHGLKQSSPTWPSSLSPKLRLPFPSPAFPTCSPKLFPFPRPSGFALQPWGLWDPGVCLFAEGFHGWGSWNQLLPEVSTPPVCAEPLSSRCHLLCTAIPLLLSPPLPGPPSTYPHQFLAMPSPEGSGKNCWGKNKL